MSTWTEPDDGGGWTAPGYTAERDLGRGATGRVVAAVDQASGQRVAIKYLSPVLLADQAFLRRFRIEMGKLRELDVPQAARVLDYIERPGEGAAVVTELVDGISLREIIGREGPLSPEAALAVLKSALLGLGAAHRLGFGHRDYQPGNVLVDAAGQLRLVDFGLAVRAARPLLSPGTPLYLSPERWDGAPASPVTDVYAATAVFFECLTGAPPFGGSLSELEEAHWNTEPSAEQVDAPLRRLVARGMAKDPASRPQSAIAFVAEIEAQAGYAYGPDWEERGLRDLAELVAPRSGSAARRAARATAPGLAGPTGPARPTQPGGRRPARTAGPGQPRRRRRAGAVVAAAAVAVIALGGVATAVTLTSADHTDGSNGGSAPQVATAITPAFSAVANVTPPVAASKCAMPASFQYTGTLSASAPGTFSYQWVYSSGKPGPVRTVSFTAAGSEPVTGTTVKAKAAGGGWADIRLLGPAGHSSGRAAYKLLCSSGDRAAAVTARAAVDPATRTASCLTTPPSFTATGSVTASKAGRVSYYWARSDGHDSSPATLDFTGPGTQAAAPLAITPTAASGSGEAVLVVTSPVAAASSPATYTLTCAPPKAPASSAAGLADGPTGSRPATQPAGSASASATLAMTPTASTLVTPGSLTLAGDVPGSTVTGASYNGSVTVSGGTGPYTWSASGLPKGLRATPNGSTLTLDGAPGATGTFPLQVSVRDSSAPAKAAAETVTVTVTPTGPSASPLTLTPVAGPVSGGVGEPFSQTFTVSGGVAPYTWSAGALPPGLSGQSNGSTFSVTGTPTRTGSTVSSVSVADSGQPQQSQGEQVTITITAPDDWQVEGAPALPDGTVGAFYNASDTVTGDVAVRWSATGLPRGLSIDRSSGTISGTPSRAGSYTVNVSATDQATGVTRSSGAQSLTVDDSAAFSPSPTSS